MKLPEIEKVLFLEKISEKVGNYILVDYYLGKERVYIESSMKIKNKDGQECSGVQLLGNFDSNHYRRINNLDDPEYFI
ncbi:hypothetical protein [Arcobacter cloacae]|uniref:Uncharacterized protein n=1 Tax=Arcobacter cloacae TaxID=1054034 RepID=A0A4Q0ZGH8_9BACT|nr:hypothetical protein [Arcobacter cloacae]RXJ84960.1 hypothetical protein CRU90_03115 [Arcobacter cloacae]